MKIWLALIFLFINVFYFIFPSARLGSNEHPGNCPSLPLYQWLKRGFSLPSSGWSPCQVETAEELGQKGEPVASRSGRRGREENFSHRGGWLSCCSHLARAGKHTWSPAAAAVTPDSRQCPGGLAPGEGRGPVQARGTTVEASPASWFCAVSGRKGELWPQGAPQLAAPPWACHESWQSLAPHSLSPTWTAGKPSIYKSVSAACHGGSRKD